MNPVLLKSGHVELRLYVREVRSDKRLRVRFGVFKQPEGHEVRPFTLLMRYFRQDTPVKGIVTLGQESRTSFFSASGFYELKATIWFGERDPTDA